MGTNSFSVVDSILYQLSLETLSESFANERIDPGVALSMSDSTLADAVVNTIRDWSKSMGGGEGGPEQRGGGSSVFEPLVRGGSCNFYLPVGGGSSCFYCGN